MYDFLVDLDNFFCEKYENYDKLCILPGYRMPTMQATRLDEYGRTYAYTLPPETMRLALQEKKEEILAELKKKLEDDTFSFSFYTLNPFQRFKNSFAKLSLRKLLKGILDRVRMSEAEVGELLAIPEEVWKGICKGKFLPTKNLIFSLALVCHLTVEDVNVLFNACDIEWDFTIPKDVVLAYLLQTKIYGEEMIAVALAEYKIRNLFMR